jgi:hypothetical protein
MEGLNICQTIKYSDIPLNVPVATHYGLDNYICMQSQTYSTCRNITIQLITATHSALECINYKYLGGNINILGLHQY